MKEDIGAIWRSSLNIWNLYVVGHVKVTSSINNIPKDVLCAINSAYNRLEAR